MHQILQKTSSETHIRAQKVEHVVSDEHNGQFQILYHYKTDLNGDGRDEVFTIRESANYSYDKTARHYLRDLVRGKGGEVTPGTTIARTNSVVLNSERFGPNFTQKYTYHETLSPQQFDRQGVEAIFHGAFLVTGEEGRVVRLKTDAGEFDVSLSEFTGH